MTDGQNNIPGELEHPSGEFISASESIGLYWWCWNNRDRKLNISPGLLKVLGYSEEEFDPSNPSIYRNIHPEDAKENIERLRGLFSGDTDLYEIEFRLKEGHGDWKWYYNRGIIIQHDEQGKPVLVGGITMELSGQFKQLLSKVEEKEKFEFIFRNSNEAIIIIELLGQKTGRVLEANKEAMELFGRSNGELMKSLPDELMEDELCCEQGSLLMQVLSTGYGRVEKEIKTGMNETRWLEITAHSFTLTGENLIIAIAKDKTPVKKTEAALRESERLYRTLFEAAEDPIGLFSVDREIILVNSAFYQTFGYSREEFFKLEWMEIIHPEDRKKLDREGRKLLSEGMLSVDYRARHKEGHYLDMSSKNVLITGEQGEQDLILTIIRDITERKRALRELEKAKNKAEESDKLKSAFLANMSHEIRTPMNSIVGFSNLLLNPGLDDKMRTIYVQRIVRNSESLLTLISDIIDLAKLESGQLPVINGKFMLSKLMGEMEQYAKDELHRLDKEQIEVTVEDEIGGFELETDVIRLTQVLKNLVNNAIKFTGKGIIKIGCRMGEDDERVILFVEDSGIGIAPEHSGVIFNQFRQIDGSNTRKFGGTGLGLAICRNLVRMMGGRIWVESELGEGALFKVELPRMAHKKTGPPKIPQIKSDPYAKRLGPLNILVVDDEQDILDLFSDVLKTRGDHVKTATTGYEALQFIENSSLPDLILMDIQMPVMSGTDTMKILKERFPKLKVVAQSAYAMVGDRDRFLKLGFDEYLAKPFTEEQLNETILALFPG